MTDSLFNYTIDNYTIHGGAEDINDYLKIILARDLTDVEWEIITEKDGTKRLKLLIKNP